MLSSPPARYLGYFTRKLYVAIYSGMGASKIDLALLAFLRMASFSIFIFRQRVLGVVMFRYLSENARHG
jgi:hypothetical protein